MVGIDQQARSTGKRLLVHLYGLNALRTLGCP
jgi:hypothetical protein